MAWYNPMDWHPVLKEAKGMWQDMKKQPKLQNREYLEGQAKDQMAKIDARQDPTLQRTQVAPVQTGQAAKLNTAQQDQFRNIQMDVAQRLAGQASGQVAGPGQMAAQDAVRRAMASQQAMARMGRGANAALAGRTAARNTAAIGVAGAGQTAQAAMQDRAMADQQLAGVLQGARGADIGLAESQANLSQQMNLANLSAENQAIFQQAGLDQAGSLAEMDAKLRAQGMNDQARLAYLSQLAGLDQAQRAAELQAQQNRNQMIGGLMQTGAQIGMMASDERVKTDVRDGAREVDTMLDFVRAYTGKYLDPKKHGEGKHAWVMAQDLERSPLGRELVVEAEDGTKMVDVRKAVSAALAASARLNERVRALEGKN
jgi:hypothetical protein